MKFFGGRMFGMIDESENPNAEVLARLDELEKLVQKSEQSLRDHTYNVVQLQSLGDRFNSVADKVATIRTYIGNIERNDNMDADQKVQEIAALYKDSEFKSLVSAMNGATRCFTSRENDIFENQNVFEAACRRACEEVMFSKEAIDMTLPYLTRQLDTYLGAYVTMGRVYDAYEAVYGAGSLKQSREEMSLRIAGCDLNGNKVQKSVTELFADYFNGDKFIFVNKGNTTNIKVNPKLLFVKDFAKRYTNKNMQWGQKDRELPDFMKKNPLNYDHVKALAEYCNGKKMLLLGFLNSLGFDAEVNGDNDEFGNALNLYLAAGAQSYVTVKKYTATSGYYSECEIQCDAVQAFQWNTTPRKLTLRNITSGATYSDQAGTIHMILFEPR